MSLPFFIPVVEHWLEREITEWVHQEGSIQRSTTELRHAFTLCWCRTHAQTQHLPPEYRFVFIKRHARVVSRPRNENVWDDPSLSASSH